MVAKRKLLKICLLRHLPGPKGKRYERKYRAWQSMRKFQAALASCEGMTSIDLGANIGEFTRILAERASRVIAFEPDPWCLEQLQKNIGELANVEIVAAAAGIEDGEVALYRHVAFDDDPIIKSQSSSVVSTKSNISKDEMHIVQQIDFPRYLDEMNTQVGILKIDIEGAEVEILEALFADPRLDQKVRYIFCETHEQRIPEQKAKVEKLRAAALRMSAPQVDLYWH